MTYLCNLHFIDSVLAIVLGNVMIRNFSIFFLDPYFHGSSPIFLFLIHGFFPHQWMTTKDKIKSSYENECFDKLERNTAALWFHSQMFFRERSRCWDILAINKHNNGGKGSDHVKTKCRSQQSVRHKGVCSKAKAPSSLFLQAA